MAAQMPTLMDTRAPYITRTRISLPYISVPNTWGNTLSPAAFLSSSAVEYPNSFFLIPSSPRRASGSTASSSLVFWVFTFAWALILAISTLLSFSPLASASALACSIISSTLMVSVWVLAAISASSRFWSSRA